MMNKRFKPVQLRKEARIPFTQEGYDKVLLQKQKLLAERPEAVENLRKSREMGDLSENGYYKAARARLSSIDANLRRLDRLVRCGVVVQSSGSGRIDIGSTVRLSDGKREYTYTVVGGYESNPLEGTISHVSPVGRAMMGKQKDDIVLVIVPSGEIRYTVLDVS